MTAPTERRAVMTAPLDIDALEKEAQAIGNKWAAGGHVNVHGMVEIILALGATIRSARRTGWIEGRNAAAKMADPPLMHRKGKIGLWRLRRAAIAKAIRALQPPEVSND